MMRLHLTAPPACKGNLMWRLAFTLVLLFAVQARAATDYPLMGIGLGSCSLFASQYRQWGATIETSYFAWGQGFMSGLNMAGPHAGREARNLKAITTEEQEARLRAYCDQHPSEDYIDAVIDLYGSLPRISKATGSGR
ncbi:MAG TPA: hypothetical protein VMA53_00030 [Stellaceae bacterium]|nr:hypothetical protein [Stellaceae bacterium]